VHRPKETPGKGYLSKSRPTAMTRSPVVYMEKMIICQPKDAVRRQISPWPLRADSAAL